MQVSRKGELEFKIEGLDSLEFILIIGISILMGFPAGLINLLLWGFILYHYNILKIEFHYETSEEPDTSETAQTPEAKPESAEKMKIGSFEITIQRIHVLPIALVLLACVLVGFPLMLVILPIVIALFYGFGMIKVERK